ncbi:MAG: hypothetical protein AAF902_24150, partial [Chloroflexota bacterium]
MVAKQSNKRSILIGLFAAGLLAAGGASAFWFGYQLMQPALTLIVPLPSQTINIATTQTGFYGLDGRSFGIEDWSSQAVALTDQGQPVPVLIDGDQLVFFAFEQTSKYSPKRVYQLHLGENAAGKELAFDQFDGRAAESAVSHQTVQRIITFEENQ